MRFDELRGLVLLLATSVAALWLAATNQLQLYIHPRYVVPTAIAGLIMVPLAIAAARYAALPAAADAPRRKGRWPVIAARASFVVCAFGVVALIATKPAALTSATATQRGVNSAAVGSAPGQTRAPVSSPLFGGQDYSNFTVKDWASLLSQTDDPDFFAGKKAAVSGFIVADTQDPKNVFYVSRFVITCCAVDARPLGVPVYQPGWQDRYNQDQWVEVTGIFDANPSSLSQVTVAVIADSIKPIPQPERVYDY